MIFRNCFLLLSFLWIPQIASSAIPATTITTATTPSQNNNIITYPLVPHHVQRERVLKERQKSNDLDDTQFRRRDIAQEVGALYQGYGTHYVDLWCGTPPQRQTVIVDTGSSVTAFPCSGCKNCGAPKYHIDNLFDEDDSSSFSQSTCSSGNSNSCTTQKGQCEKDGTCTIGIAYAEGSRWKANESTDLCYIGGPHDAPLLAADDNDNHKKEVDIDPHHASQLAFDLVFGCQTLVTGLFKTQLADGIMGMDMRKDSFWYQMFNAGKLGPSKQFALCFSRQPMAERDGTEAGALTLGGVDPRLHTSDMVFTSRASGGRTGFFSVKVRKVYLREGTYGQSVKSTSSDALAGVRDLGVSFNSLNSGGVIVDSGTTDTYWNRHIATAFKQAFQEMTGRPYTHSALTLTEEELAAFPTILFQLVADPEANAGSDPAFTVGLAGALDSDYPKDVIIAFPPTHYMEYDPDDGKWTARFYPQEAGGSVLGANAMMGHDVMFDVDKDRIGWAESNCDYTKLVTENGYEFTGKTGTTSGSNANDDDDDDQTKADKTKEKAKHGEYEFGNGIKEFADACDSLECRGAISFGLVVALCMGCCVARCFCTSSARPDSGYRIALSKSEEEIELSSNGNGAEFSSYKDEPDGDDHDDDDDHLPDEEQPSSKEAEFEGDFI
jgi:hypothetical protein